MQVPYNGWFEAVVEEVLAKTQQAAVQWSSDRVGSGGDVQTSWLDLGRFRWSFCVSSAAVALRPGEQADDWLQRAVLHAGPRGGCLSSHVFFSRWWTEVRWGFVRFSTTPAPVLRRLQELQEARSFLAGVTDDKAFWQGVNDRDLDVSEVCRPLGNLIECARKIGGQDFSRDGMFTAPSVLQPGRQGLFALVLMYPADLVGIFHVVQDRRIFNCVETDASRANCELSFFGPSCRGKKQSLVLTVSLPVFPLGELAAVFDAGSVAEDSPADGCGICVRPYSNLAVHQVGVDWSSGWVQEND